MSSMLALVQDNVDLISDTGAEYVAAQAVLRDLKAARDATAAALQAAETELAKMVAEGAETGLEYAVLALIGDADGARELLPVRITRLRMELARQRQAVAEQRGKVRDLRSTASAEAALAVLPQHRRAVGAIAAAVDQLHRAIAAERAIRADLVSQGYEPALRDFGPPMFCLLNENDAVSSAWLREARSYAQ